MLDVSAAVVLSSSVVALVVIFIYVFNFKELLRIMVISDTSVERVQSFHYCFIIVCTFVFIL